MDLEKQRKLKKIEQEFDAWHCAARVIPIIGVITLLAAYWFGTSETHHKLSILVTGLFSGIAAFWWYWIMRKVQSLINLYSHSIVLIDDLREILKSVKQDLKE